MRVRFPLALVSQRKEPIFVPHHIHHHNFLSVRTQVPRGSCIHMRDAETYSEFANECRRLASKASEKDKSVLLRIAEAWDEQAKIAGQAAAKADGRDRSDSPNT